MEDPPMASVPVLTLVSFGGGLPLLGADDGQADLALLVDVGVVDLGLEGDLGGLEGVVGREVELDQKRPLVVGGLALGRGAGGGVSRSLHLPRRRRPDLQHLRGG